MSDELVITNKDLLVRDTAELGKYIHAEAMERTKKEREDAIIEEVQRLEDARLEYLKKAEFAARASDWYRRKLEAVQKGEFDFDLVNAQMLFRDPEFQKANF